MTVFDNMAFGLKLRKTPKDEIKRRVEEAARILSLIHIFFRIEAVTAPSVHLYGLVVIGALLCNSFAKYFAINLMILNFRMVSSGYDKYVTTLVEDESVALELTRGVVSDIPTVAVQQKADRCV